MQGSSVGAITVRWHASCCMYHKVIVVVHFFPYSEKLCNQLTESIDAGDTALAKRVLNVLLTFDKGPGKFQAKCIVPEQVKPVYMYVAC